MRYIELNFLNSYFGNLITLNKLHDNYHKIANQLIFYLAQVSFTLCEIRA